MAISMSAEGLVPLDELRRQLDEAKHTLEAIQNDSVDAVVVNGPNGPQIFTLESPDYPFRTFVEGMQEGALTLDRDGTIRYANAFFAALIGRPVAEVLGAPFSSFVPPEYQSTCARLVEQGCAATSKDTLRLNGANGSIPIQVTLSPLWYGAVATCCAVVFDLREREQAERASAAREAAEEANAAKDRFLAVLGHELRSPLNTVLGWAQILAGRSDLDAGVRKAVRAIERNARAQAQLISELLDVSRIIAGKLHLEFEVVDIKAVVLSAVTACKLTVRKGIDIKANITEDDLSHGPLLDGDSCVLGDATRLQQVVTNLLDNAVKFTEGDGTIEIRVEQADRHIALTVTDTGSGIPAHQIDNIFHSFHQPVGSRRKGGLGLGLSISKQLVEAHGGQIRVASPGPGLGATFTVHLPRVNGPVPSAEEVHSIESRLNDRSILVIDDDADLLELLRYALEHRGARVDTVQSAAAALSKLCDHSYDVLVSDLGLPDQDGLALMQEIRARGHLGPSLRAVALTGYASEADARLCKAAGFELHLIKPIGPWEVARAITRLLEGPAPNRPQPAPLDDPRVLA